MSIPPVMGDARYLDHLAHREAMFERRAGEAMRAFEGCDAVITNRPGGAFYFTVMFKPGVLSNKQTLKIDDPRIRRRIEDLVANVQPDKRFVYYLMGATGIVVVPLTGFQCAYDGFRMTLLESDDAKRAWILKTLREAVEQYISS
jgi:aspartate/methionine/tyrosine aminotransferase